MAASLQEELTDAVFRTVLEPDAWNDVMQLMRRRFPSSAQTFYFLNLQSRRVRPISLQGIEARWVDSFNACYFASDNPWVRLTERLHRTGVVRTNERLDRLMSERGVLYRSSYYNDWMRPQGFKYTIGNTLLADESNVANITLLRSPDMATFDDDEVKAFEALSRQLTQALQIALKLEWAQGDVASARAFDALPEAVVLVDTQRQVKYANRAMESMLRARHGLELRHGLLRALQPEAQQRLTACISNAFASIAGGATDAAPLILRYNERDHLVIRAVPATGVMGQYLPSVPMVLLMIADPSSERCVSCDELRALYAYTRSEARLVQLLVQGKALLPAATAMGITYGTARIYLKGAFQKVGVHSQTQLVARVLRDTPGPNYAGTDRPKPGSSD
jgi:DNA-binding CsgD family transcriptional regulator